MPGAPPISTLTDGCFALDFANGSTWASEFVGGPENQLLKHALAEFCAGRTGLYNPLVLCGPSGVGKTHLVLGLAQHLTAAEDESSALVESGADLARSYSAAVDSRRVLSWREMRRTVNLLVIDEISSLAEKAAAQIELLHTIDARIDAGLPVIITSRVPLERVSGLMPALKARLIAGLVVPVALPDVAVRRVLLARMAASRTLPIDEEAIDLLAARLDCSIPELSGALHELATGSHTATGAAIHGTTADRIDRRAVLAYLAQRPADRAATLRQIASQAARHFALTVADLRGPSRRQNISLARSLAMYVARQVTGKSLEAVGKYFGGRDHTTVLHACRKIEDLLAREPDVRRTVQELRTALIRA